MYPEYPNFKFKYLDSDKGLWIIYFFYQIGQDPESDLRSHIFSHP